MRRLTIPLAVFALLALILLSPVLQNITYWGQHDWDQHFLYHGTAEVTIKKFHQFPLWNPFYCGGNPYLANPQTPFLTPFFLINLLFGTVIGLKLQAIIYFFLGLLGMYLLAKELDIKGYAAFIPPIVFMMSSWYALRVMVGHTTFFPFALLPWVFLFYIKSQKQRHYIVFAALLMALMFLAGGVYPLLFTAVFLGFYALFESVELKNARPLVLLAVAALLVASLSAVKLFPMVEFTTAAGFKIEDRQFASYSLMVKGLFERNQDIESQNELIGRSAEIPVAERQRASVEGRIPWGWHEYSAYLGILAFLLFLLAFLKFRENWKLIVISIIFLLLSLGEVAAIPLWSFLRLLPFFSSVHLPSRFIIMFVFCAAILAGKAASEARFLKNRAVMLAVVMLIALDMALVSRPALSGAFPVRPFEINTYDYYEYKQIYIDSDIIIGQYPNMLQNLGTWNCYERIHLRQHSVPELLDVAGRNPNFMGNAYFAGSNTSFDFSYFSPNRIEVEFQANDARTLVLNQNYYKGWKAEGREAFSYEGLIAADIKPGETKAVFYYLPGSFILGLIISILSLAACIFFLRLHES